MRKYRFLVFFCLVLFAAGTVLSMFIWNRPHGSAVDILRDKEVLYQFDLSTAEDQMIEIEYEGRVNTIQIQDHRIRMLEADCPDHTCVHMGWLDSGVPIVCLPNHLVIQFSSQVDDVDVVVN